MGVQAAIAIGVSKAGDLPQLSGARQDAQEFADWAHANAYDHVTLIEDRAGAVTVAMIKDALKVALAKDLERLLLFFSGHGASNAVTDFWLLTNYNTDSNEAVDLNASFNNAKRLPIGQIAVFADACRSSPPDLAGIHGSAIFPRVPTSPEVLPKWDHFLATRLGEIAQEAPGETERLAFGVFSRCLFQALRSPPGKFLERRDQPVGARVLCSDKLADFLDETVPLESGRIPGGRVQFPETSSGWRKPRDVYLELGAARRPNAHQDIPPPRRPMRRTAAKRSGGGASAGFSRPESAAGSAPGGGASSGMGRAGPGNYWDPGRSSGAAERTQARVKEARQSLARKIQGDSAAFELKGRPSFETRSGLTVHGERIAKAVERGGAADLFEEAGLQHVRGHATEARTVVLRTANGPWFPTVTLPGFVGIVTLQDGAAVSFNYQRIGGGDPTGDQMVRHWTALMTAGHAPREDYRKLAHWIRMGKHDNPALGVLAAYAYARAGDLDGVDSIIGYFAAKGQPVLYDLALLGTSKVRRDGARLHFLKGVPHGNARLDARIAGSFPLMTGGWALLDREDPTVHPALSKLRAGLRPSLWTMLAPTQGAQLAALVREGAV
ncbi:MAG TPA: caspase family protein [Allosphingosinicella sp.]|jgi:hypothetical protein